MISHGGNRPEGAAGRPEQGYTAVTVAIDNSPESGYAEDLAVLIARATGSSVTGLHAYTGRFHRNRFQALEGHLPERYQKEEVLEHQRSIHSVLIERGMELISSEYMKRLRDRCGSDGIPFSEIITDGKNSDVIISASRTTGLMTMGAGGLGRTGPVPPVGSNTRRMLRHGECDLLVARKGGPLRTILAAIDGSEEAERMTSKAAGLAKSLGARFVIATSFDPGLHRTVFGSLSDVLSESAGKTFRFSEQENLHNEIIDKSLARLYTGYLEKAAAVARVSGVTPEIVLLQGKPYASVCAKAAEIEADLIVVSRNGMHRGAFCDIGSNAENIAEHAGTNVLITTTHRLDNACNSRTVQAVPAGGAPASGITWSAEAQQRLERVPVFARPMAVMAIERFAKENGKTVITPEVMSAAREKMGI